MLIQLNKNYRITADRRQWILQNKSGDEWKNQGFFVDLETLLKYYIEQQKRLSKSNSIYELLEYQKALLDRLNLVLAPLKVEVITKE